MPWPCRTRVFDFRWAGADAILALLAAHAGHDDIAEIEALVALGLQHEQQHQELLFSDIKHALSCNPAAAAYGRRWPMAQVGPQPLRWFGYTGGLVGMGHLPRAAGAFCLDNETPRHRA